MRASSRIALKHVVGVQLIRLAAEAADRLNAIDELRIRLRACALELVCGGPVVGEIADAAQDHPLQIAEGHARRRGRRDLEHTRHFARVLVSDDIRRNLLVVDQRSIERDVLP
jgi:hypothetical protein